MTTPRSWASRTSTLSPPFARGLSPPESSEAPSRPGPSTPSSVGLDLALPDGQVGLDRLDHGPADLEGLGAVTGCHGDHDRRLAHAQPAHAVADRDDRVGALGRALGDAVQGLLGVGVRAVLERHDRARGVGVDVTHAPDEGGDRPRRRVLHGVEVGVRGRGASRTGGRCGRRSCVISSGELVEHVRGELGDDGDPGCHGTGRPGKVDDQGSGSAMPARPREMTAIGVSASPRRRSSSAMPGISRSSTRVVPSGVRSVGAMPVPPVVTMRPGPSARRARSAVSTLSAPSATMTGRRSRIPPRAATTLRAVLRGLRGGPPPSDRTRSGRERDGARGSAYGRDRWRGPGLGTRMS